MVHRATNPGGRLRPTRRQFIVGGAATALLVACGNDDADDEAQPDFSVVRFYGPSFAAGAVARVPFALADMEGPLSHDLSPESVSVSVRDVDGNVLVDGLSAPLHHDGIPRPYYAFETSPDAPGIYDILVDVDGTEVRSQFQVVEADDPSVASRVDPGDPFPGVATPTVDDPMEITPICTREPHCDLHDHSIDALLGTQPIALLISTPEFCQIGVCGPVLDLLIDSVPDYPDLGFVHAEVYRNPSELAERPTPDDLAPIMAQTGLPYEPVLYTIDADGTVINRLDYIFDGAEIRRELDAVT